MTSLKAKQRAVTLFQTGMKKIGISDQSTDEEMVKYWEKVLNR
jgi:hypothetical protein